MNAQIQASSSSIAEENEIAKMKLIFSEQKHVYAQSPYPEVSLRVQQLKTLKQLVLAKQQNIIEALSADFGHRSHDETRIAELLTFVEGVKSTIKQLTQWAKPSKRKVGLLFMPASNKVVYQPLGVVGIIVPWNYPLFLSLGPLIGALSAGNRVMLKLSEFTPHFNTCLKQLLAQVFDEAQVSVITGEVAISSEFSALPFNHLFFTGSTAVGRIVMASAAKNLTPVTLELGGKSPVIISGDVDIKMAAERICFGKSLNSGQTCVAPDYILCPKDKKDAFIEAYAEAFFRMYPNFSESLDYSSIINEQQYQRLQDLVKDAKAQGAKLIKMSTSTKKTDQPRKMAPILIDDVQDDMRIMQEELFGPLLPIIGYKQLNEAIDYINQRPRPLALYIFSFDKKVQDSIIYNTHSGGVCINNTMTHLAQDDMPFGGVGQSGMGCYHGHDGFLTFSKAKGIHKIGRLNSAKLILPPYDNVIHRFFYRLFIR
jgi:coniferyl-aldehyde dehydrogenase